MKPTTRSTALAALSAALFLSTAGPVQAQGLVGAGHGTYFSPTSQDDITFTFLVTERLNGTVEGLAIWQGPLSTIVFELTSYGFFELTPGTTSLAAAGPIVAILGNPVPGLGAEIGRTAFFAVNDNGRSGPDETSGLSVVPPLSSFPFPIPPQFGNLTTIQQLYAFGQFLGVPPPVWRPLLRGNVLVR